MTLSLADGRSRSWAQVKAYAEQLLAPGLGRPLTAAQPSLHPVLDVVAATAEVRTSLEGKAAAHVAVFGNDGVELLRPGWRPQWSPDGTRLANVNPGGVQVDDRQVALAGNPERLEWSPDGSRLLVVLAEPGSELPNLDGSGLVPHPDEADAWLPHVSSGVHHVAWRRLLVVDADSLECSVVSRADLNVWDACWAGPSAVLAVCSDGSPSESGWFRADLRHIEVATSADRVVHQPPMQLGVIAASPSGRHAAYVEAICSDRDLSAGSLHLLDLGTGARSELAVPLDVTSVQFVDDALIGFAGVRGLVTVVGTVTTSGEVQVRWESERDSTTGAGPQASFRDGRVAFVRAGFQRPPEMCLLRDRELTTIASLAHPGTRVVSEAPWTSETRRWTAEDGLEIEGWLHLPAGEGPHPLVVHVHGGPVTSHRAGWQAYGLTVPYLLAQGYAVLQPNPRGSSGRGPEFAGAVVGDMGGADTWDITSGVVELVSSGLVDPDRVGVMGGSYGGFMTAWLVTQCDLFAAAVSMHPITDWLYQHGTSNIPYWDELFLDGQPYAEDGLYRQRSPLTHVHRVRTPTMFIAGHLDRATPAGQALVMHQALVDLQVPSECVVFPQEAHGARDLSAVVDNAARIADWFAQWMPAREPARDLVDARGGST